MTLVDTSVLIDWLRGAENPKTKAFDSIVSTGAPFAISIFTFQEVLQGARNGKEYEKLRDYLGTQTILGLPYDLTFHEEAAKAYIRLRSQGKTIRSTVDLLIAMTAVREGAALLHNDRDFDQLAGVLGELKIV